MTNKWILPKEVQLNYATIDSFVILIGVSGLVQFYTSDFDFELTKGDAYLVPAIINELRAEPIETADFLEVYIY